MSPKKEKLIEEAQRLALRGQLDKAIKAYEQVLALDPSAINQRQRLAELLVRAGRAEDARAEFEIIGKHYANNSFFLKAIAVYKQLQKLFPGDVAIAMMLAELNEKHGLVGNALAEYKQVYDHYEKAGQTEEALKILERMQDLDPQNIAIRLKLAESDFQVGNKVESYTAFVRLASLLHKRGDEAALSRLNVRIRQLFPENSTFMLDVLSGQVEEGNAANAVMAIQALLRSDPGDRRIWELIVAAYRKLNQPQRVKIACQHYLRFFPDELSPRKGLLECLVVERELDQALELLEGWEQDFVHAGAGADLLWIYQGLHGIDPVNMRVLEGLKRAYEAVGDKVGAEALEVRLDSYTPLGGKPPEEDLPVTAEPVAEPGEAAPPFELVELAEADALDLPDEDEIEIEIDDDIGFEGVEAKNESSVTLGDSWLDSVGEIFDSMATSPRSVRFGSDLDTEDAQSHHDLGVAFKEMGLYDEAISEFRQAAADPARKVECRVLQGACLREKGELEKAEGVLRALLNPGLNLDDACLVRYELMLTCTALEKGDEAAALLAEIDSVNPGYRDVRSRLDSAGWDKSLDFSDEDLQGFDLK
ncbi:MAG: tetratricopeptide repeat protein [Deltaproteobacteria bacterium]|nr:tetratricopeptide repeat protein [Deltaproteobacteria bacterium]